MSCLRLPVNPFKNLFHRGITSQLQIAKTCHYNLKKKSINRKITFLLSRPVTPTLDVGNTIEAGLKVYKEIISNIKNGIESLLITEQLTNIAKLLANLNVEMQTKQK